MRVLDLYSGLNGWTQAFRERGHDCFGIEIRSDLPTFGPGMKPELVGDITLMTADDIRKSTGWRRPDLILASPPCKGWSVMSIGRNWTKDHEPKTDIARLSRLMVQTTLRLMEDLHPTIGWVMENPRAKLRKMPFMDGWDRRTVTYCQYGERRMKPTDLWRFGRMAGWETKEPCKNGAPCHDKAPRGSRTGTQGMDPTLSARIPHALSLEACLWAEQCFKVSRFSRLR